jgi:hypothetical protein
LNKPVNNGLCYRKPRASAEFNISAVLAKYIREAHHSSTRYFALDATDRVESSASSLSPKLPKIERKEPHPR